MKRHQKLLAFVLTVTLLLSSFVIPATTASASSADSAAFVSSANTTKLSSTGAPQTVKNTIDLPGSMTNAIGTTNVFGNESTLNTYVVDSDDMSYIMLSPNEAAIAAGAMNEHSYLEFQVNKKIQKNTEDDYRYYVLEINIATESKVLPINPQIVSRLDNAGSGTGSFGAEWSGARNGSASEYVNMTPGDFYHYTFIGDIYTNTLYIYINNVLVQTNANGVMNASHHRDVYNAGNFLFINGLRFGVTTSGAPITENMSLAIDNLNQRMLKEADAGNLASYAGQASLQGWDKNTYTVGNYLGSLPSLVTVNGTDYNNVIDANRALDNVAGSNTVSACRALYSGTIVVNCNADISTHGLDFPLKAGENATLTQLPHNRFESKLTSLKHFTTVDTESATTLGSPYISSISGNKVTSLYQPSPPANTMQTTTFVQEDGNKYATYYPLTDASGFPSGAHIYYEVGVKDNGSAATTLLSKFTQIVFEVDLLSDYKFLNFYTNFNSRSAKDSGSLPSNSVLFHDIIDAAEAAGISVPAGEWLHFTFVGNVASGDADIYMNAQYIMTVAGMLWNQQTINELDKAYSDVTIDASNVADYAFFRSARTLQIANINDSAKTLEKSMSVSSDNYYIGYISDASVYSKAARTSSSWSIYSQDYNFPMRDPIATIDGTEYYSLVDIAEALNADYGNAESNGHVRNVIFFRDYFGDVNVNCRATINQNSVVSRNGSFVYASDTTNETADGLIEVYKLTNTFAERSDAVAETGSGQSGKDYTDVPDALMAPNKKVSGDGVTYVTKSDGSDNLYKSHFSGNIKDGREVYITTVTDVNGKQHTVLKETGGTGHSDIYNATYYLQKNINDYFFIEIDMAYMGALSASFLKENLGIYIQASRTPTAGGNSESITNTFSIEMSDVLAGKVGAEFSHITIIGSVYDEKVYTFVDNKLVNVYNASKTFGEEDGYTYSREFRLMFFPGATNGETLLYDNVYMGIHTVTDAMRADINASVASGTLQGKYAINTEAYEYPTYATKYLAVVDGEYFLEGQEMALAEALTKYSDDPIKVEFLSEPQAKITIKGNANIDTNGMDLSDWIVADTSTGYTAQTTGNTTTVTGPKPSNKLTETLVDSGSLAEIYNAVKYQISSGMSENTFSGLSPKNYFMDGSHKLYVMKNQSTGDLYAHDSIYNLENPPSTSGIDSYVELQNSNKTAYTGKGQFVIVDGDFAFESYSNSGKILFNTRKGDGTSAGVYNHIFIDTIMQEAGIPVGSFAHVTMVGFVETGTVYVYVNGRLAGSQAHALYTPSGYGDGYYLASIRYGQRMDLQFSYDNIYIRVVNDSNVTTPESFIGSREDIYTGKGHSTTTAPAIATVDGIKYYSIDELENALTSDTRVEVEFHHVPIRPINVNTLANINTNALASQSEMITIGTGFAKNTSASTSSYIVIDIQKNYGRLTVNISLNGVQTTIVDNVSLVYGTSIKDYLTENGYLNGGFVICDTVWHGVTWNSSFNTAVINSSSKTVVGEAAGTVTGDYILVNADESYTTVSASNADCDDQLRNHFSKSGDSMLILNRDWTVKHTLSSDGETWNSLSFARSGNKGIYLNNHAMIGDRELTANTHGMVVDASSANITFYRGDIDFRALTTTQAFIFAGYSFTGSITMKNVDIKVSVSLIQARSGSYTLDGCTVDAYLPSSYSPLFQIGEDYNKNYTKTPISLTIKDSEISHRYTVSYANDRYSSYSIITPMIKQTIVTTDGALDPHHTVNITDSEIITQGALVQANTTINTADATVHSNMTVSLKSTSVHAKSWSNGNIKRTVITLSDDVKTNIGDDSMVLLGDNVKRTRVSGDIHQYLYTTHDFASVTWSNGEHENWAAGSVPYNPLCKFDDISAAVNGVVAGEKYTFTESADAAPFKFYASLTLSDKIGFNLLIPDGFEVSKVIIDGHILTPNDAKAGESATIGGACTYYTVFFAPHEAGRSFNISIILADGTVMSRDASVGTYARSLWEKVKDGKDLYSERNRALLSVALLYIEQATAYAGYHIDMSELSSVLTSAGLISDAPTGTDHTGTNETLASYIRSAQVSLRGSYAIRFNLASDTQASSLAFYIDGRTASTTVGDGYIDVSLRAYDMNKDIEIYIGSTKLGTYNLYTYYSALSTLTGTQGGDQHENTAALKLIRALWNYANTADQYLDAEENG